MLVLGKVMTHVEPVVLLSKKNINHDYIVEGGFPKTLSFSNLSDKMTYVKGVITEIFEKDIYWMTCMRSEAIWNLTRKIIRR